jgi:hypothetical protein
MRGRLSGVLAVSVGLMIGCSDDPPTAPSPVPAGITAGAIVPANGASVTATGEPPGAMLLRESNSVMVPLTLTSGRDVSFAELMVFLQESNGNSCGANTPNRPTWAPLRATDRVTVTITGFQVFRLPCNVVSIRALVHTRINPSLLTVPTPDEILADITIPASFVIR